MNYCNSKEFLENFDYPELPDMHNKMPEAGNSLPFCH